jgi:hypothetical protein
MFLQPRLPHLLVAGFVLPIARIVLAFRLVFLVKMQL